jgi:hypothetical protein
MRKYLHLLVMGAVVVALGACNYVAGQYVDATATVWVLGADKVPYRIGVQLYTHQAVAAAGERVNVTEGTVTERAIVTVAKCPSYKCLSATPYVATVAVKTASSKPTEATYDDSDAAKLVLAVPGWGGALKVVWNARPQGVVDGAPGAPSADGDVDSAGTATSATQVTFLGATCTDPKGVVVRHTTVSPYGLTQPLGKRVPLVVTPDLPARPKCVAAP